MLKVCDTTTDYLESDSVFFEYYSKVSSYRRQKIDRLKGTEEKRRSLASELLLMEAMSQLDIPYDGEIEIGEHGKPYLKNNSSIFYSISHAGNRVMCVVSDKQVGCDVERIDRVSGKIADRYFTINEKEYLDSVDENEVTIKRAGLWCLKESYGKMTGEGLGAVIAQNEFDVSGDEKGVIVANGTEYCCWEKEGYCYAYCKSLK